MKIINDPWPHTVIDNFLPKEKYAAIVKECVDYLKSHVRTKRRLLLHTEPDFAQHLPITLETLNSIDFLGKLDSFEDRRTGDVYHVEHEISFMLDGQEYPIHDECEKKVLSNVIYLFPNVGTGTLIYDTEKSYVKTVEWKQNRALLFAGITDKTWHNYKTDHGTLRITINSFVCRS